MEVACEVATATAVEVASDEVAEAMAPEGRAAAVGGMQRVVVVVWETSTVGWIHWAPHPFRTTMQMPSRAQQRWH
jgi:hypothetical protein